MHYVILRDDDTCALTPVDCLDRLYRPFLERGLPVSLAVIPDVNTDARRPDGRREEFLQFNHGTTTPRIPIGQNKALVKYLQSQPLFTVLHHGYDHSPYEFDCSAREAERRLAAGAKSLRAAGFANADTFVAPHDRFSRASIDVVARHYRMISTGWYEARRLPAKWWPAYFLKKYRKQKHWRVGETILLSHPGCLLSRYRPCASMLDRVQREVKSHALTILVTHWWEYYQEGRPDEEFISVLHRTANFLANDPDVRVVTFSDVATGRVAIPELQRPDRQTVKPGSVVTGAPVAP
jgi:predicted deacetylase